MLRMTSGYSEFCPIAKASEIFAMRWTPLILRELMCDAHTFNDIHRGVPLISRALLAERLRQLDEHGIIEKKSRLVGSGCEYRLTPAGYAFHDALRALAQWGLLYGRDRLSTEDLNPGLLMWRIRRRADTKALSKNRVVVRFEFSGVPPSRTRLRTMWLILERPGADVCLRDPGFPVDLTVHGDIAVLIAIYLGYESWKDMVGCKKLRIEGDRRMAHQLPTLLRLDKLLGRDYRPLARQAARAS
jgi:DNA-binding HxlR family transcriptional regulator